MNKKVIIFTSIGGGGHTSASNALKNYLHNAHDVISVNIFDELLHELDIFSALTFGKYSGEEIYNIFVPKKYFGMLSWFYSFGAWFITLRQKTIHRILRNYLIQKKPTLIISVVPIINFIILDVAQELDIPFLLIPTDLDVNMYLLQISNPLYQEFYIGLPFFDEQIMAPIKRALIPNKQCLIIGAPLNPDFFIIKNKKTLKKQYSIEQNKPVIMVLMGARGSCEIENYATQLLNITSPVHLILCIGRNEENRQNITSLPIPAHITVSIVGFTDHIADYMTIADLLISKSGSQSVCEALYTNTPIFLDATSPSLPWEKFNHLFIKQHGFGNQITEYDLITSQISLAIENSQNLLFYKKNLEQLEKINCQKSLMAFLNKILEK